MGNTKPLKKKHHIGLIVAIAVLIVVVAVALAVLVLGRYSSDRALRRQLDLGNRYLSELNYDQAIAAFEEALSIDPKNTEAYLGLIDAYGRLEDYDHVISVFQTAEQNVDESDIDTLRARAFDYLIEGARARRIAEEYDEALDLCEKTLVIVVPESREEEIVREEIETIMAEMETPEEALVSDGTEVVEQDGNEPVDEDPSTSIPQGQEVPADIAAEFAEWQRMLDIGGQIYNFLIYEYGWTEISFEFVSDSDSPDDENFYGYGIYEKDGWRINSVERYEGNARVWWDTTLEKIED